MEFDLDGWINQELWYARHELAYNIYMLDKERYGHQAVIEKLVELKKFLEHLQFTEEELEQQKEILKYDCLGEE
jgi:hypothetical protein